MPRCLMAKKWKAYPWQDRAENTVTNQQITEITDTVVITTDSTIETVATAVAIEEDEEIDVVGDSPSANATASVVNSYATTNIDTQHNTTNSITSTTTTTSSAVATSSVIVGKTSVIPTCWAPSSPQQGTTAEEAHSSEGATRGATILYNGKWSRKFYIYHKSSIPTTILIINLPPRWSKRNMIEQKQKKKTRPI